MSSGGGEDKQHNKPPPVAQNAIHTSTGEDPNIEALTDPNTNPNPLGISPPGMRLRSGRKKKETPLKESLSSSKRRRDEDADEHENGEGDNNRIGKRSSKRRALDSAFEKVVEHENEDEVRDETMEEVHDRNGDKEEDDDDDAVMVTTDNDQNGHHNHVGAGKKKLDVRAALQVVKNNKAKGIAANFGNSTTPSTARVLLSSPPAATAVAASSSSILSPPVVNLRLPSQHTPAPKKIKATYAGNARLQDFVTPAKPSAMANVNLNGTSAESEVDADADAAGVDVDVEDKNYNTSIAGTDSEIEQLELKGLASVEVEKEEEERDEGRRDGLFHYFRNKYFFDQPEESSNRPGVTIGLGMLVVLLHILLMWMNGGSVGDGGMVKPMIVWKDVPGVANRTLEIYRTMGILKVEEAPVGTKVKPEPKREPKPETKPKPDPKTIVVEEVVENIILVDNLELEERERDLLLKRQKIALWRKQKEEAAEEIAKYQKLVDDEFGAAASLSQELEVEERRTAERMGKLAEWGKPLMKIHIVEENEDSEEVSSIIQDLLNASEMPIAKEATRIISFDDVTIPGEGCTGDFILESDNGDEEEEGEEEEYVTEEMVADAKRGLSSEVSDMFSEIRPGQESFRPIEDWMANEIRVLAEEHSFDTDLPLDNFVLPSRNENKEKTIDSNFGMSLSDLQTIIDERVEIDRADVTGKHDFASLRSGGSIVYTGSRQTSASLVENLPLGNQLMAKLGLRFYGHGPHAALEPTFPKDALGQCWSFEREGENSRITIKEWAGDEKELENEPDRGEFATLAVNLANPIFVRSVAIEHAPKAISDNRSTAIRKFRVIGFQSFDASGSPWLLGDFEYNSGKDDYLQEFEVNTKLENGVPIPKLASIVLAVDSNWGAEYSCLYRFRVHGQSKWQE